MRKKGFTLIEVIVAAGLFSVVMVLATSTFVVFVQQQRRTINQQELQNDARATMEEIANRLHENTVDYTYYATIFDTVPKKLFKTITGKDDECLVLINDLKTQYYYRLYNNKIQEYSTDTPDYTDAGKCSNISSNNWQDISPASLTVNFFSIFISPSQDPFQGKSYTACGLRADSQDPNSDNPDDAICSASSWGAYCGVDFDTCAYVRADNNGTQTCYCTPLRYGDVIPLHPKVTYSLNVSRQSNNTIITDTFQTTITSRIFKNFDLLNRYAP